MLDVAIRNAKVVDGSGSPWFYGDVGICDGRIVSIGLHVPPAYKEVDATGKFVTPGFIDIHSHTDHGILDNKLGLASVCQGITTQAVGNCGGSTAPVRPGKKGRRGAGFRTFSDWFDAVARNGMGLNLIPFVGHGVVRAFVMGDEGEGGERPVPTPDELKQMVALVREAYDQGVAGFTTGLEYPPGRNAYTSEVIDLSKAVAPDGIYMSHVRWQTERLPDAIQEVIDVGEGAGITAIASHLKAKALTPGVYADGPAVLDMMSRARERGVDVLFDVYPWEIAGVNYLHQVALPPWLYNEGVKKEMELLKQPDTVSRIKYDLEHGLHGWTNQVKIWGWYNLPITCSMSHKEYNGKSIDEIAAETGKDPVELALQIIYDDECGTSAGTGRMSYEHICLMLQHPLGMVSTDMGSIDEFPKGPEGLPAAGHPRTYATYPELLRRFVLTGKAVTVEEAIRKSTSLPARSMKLQDRGTLKVGAWADVVVIDLDNVAPVATYEDPHQYPKGVDYVLVNGVPVVDCGKPTGRTPGKMLVRR